MSPRLRVCFLLLLALSSVNAFPQRIPGDKDAPVVIDAIDEEPEDRINIHHTLKDAVKAASRAMKDVEEYIRQQVNSIGKKSLNIIGHPLMKLAAPMIYMKDQVGSLLGHENPSNLKDITATTGEPSPTDQSPIDLATLEVNNTKLLDPVANEESPLSHPIFKRKASSQDLQGNYLSEMENTQDLTAEDDEEPQRNGTLRTSSAKKIYELLDRVRKLTMDIRLGPGQPLLLANIFKMGRPNADFSTELPQLDSTSEEPGYSTTQCLICVFEGGKTHEYGEEESDEAKAIMSILEVEDPGTITDNN